MIEIEYELKREDMVAFADHHASHAPYITTRTRRMRWIWCALLAVNAALALQYSMAVAVLLAVLSIVFAGLYPQFTRWWYRRHNRRVYERSGAAQFGRCKLTLEVDQIRTTSQAGESTIKLAAIERVESTPALLVAYIGPVQAVVIPKNRIIRGDIDALADKLTRVVKSAA